MRFMWLGSVPILVLAGALAVRSAPLFAGPACVGACSGPRADQVAGAGTLTTYGPGVWNYQQIPGQYCSDATGGLVYVPSGAKASSGLTCPAVTATPTATSSAAATSSTPASPPPATGTASPSATAATASTGTATPSR